MKKTVISTVYDVLDKPHGSHKAKIYSRYKKDKEKQIKATHYGKPSIHKGRQQKRKKGKGELQHNQKTINKMVLVCP